MNLLPPGSMRTVRMRDRGVMCVLSVISIHSGSCQPVRLLISGDTRRNRAENTGIRILHDNEACLIDEKFILRKVGSEYAENEFKSCSRTNIQYFAFGNCIIIMLFKSLKSLYWSYYSPVYYKICHFTFYKNPL